MVAAWNVFREETPPKPSWSPAPNEAAMKIVAPNILVIGNEIFDLEAPVGRPNLPAAAAKYEAEVETLFRKIKAQPFGAAWLEIVGNNREPIIIVPSTATDNAAAQTMPNIPQRPDRTADAQNGRGTPGRVKFNTQANLGFTSGGVSGEVLLVHEVTHAYRAASGRLTPLPMEQFVTPDSLKMNLDLARRFPDFEEWLAIVVENVFASQAGKTILRTNWELTRPSFATNPGYFTFWGISTVGTRNDSQQFAHDYRPGIERIRSAEPRLFQAMEATQAWFNPVRDYRAEMLSSRI